MIGIAASLRAVKKSAKTGIDELAQQIRDHRQRYYNGEPEISDAEFDALEDRLRALAPDHPVRRQQRCGSRHWTRLRRLGRR